ncbi:protein translocase subunit SecF [soil metagenome]
MTTTEIPGVSHGELPVGRTAWQRLVLGQTAIDFWRRRFVYFGVSVAAILLTVVSLVASGLSLGLDFEGGVSWDVPAAELTVEDARGILDANGIDGADAKIQERSSDSGDIIKVQVGDQPDDVRAQLQVAFAEAAGVERQEVSVNSVSSTWGWQITKKAILALAVFLGLIAIFISLRFEWRMAVSALLAMVHDVIVSVGVYSVFNFEVTPATVIAFLTILGYSLYDTIVVFDRVRENERRLAAAGLSAADLVNVSTNQVLLRSVNTSISAVLPVLSLLLIGAGLLGQVTLREFAIALLVGMLTGAYSSIFIAAPCLGYLKAHSETFARRRADRAAHLTGEDLRAVVVTGAASVKAATRRRGSSAVLADDADDGAPATLSPSQPTERLLIHPPRPRKKKRR